MAEAAVELRDENGKEIRSLAKKVIEPRPAPEDLTRVRTGPEIGDYEYVDPASLFALERLIAAWSGCKTKRERYEAGREFKKFVRDVAEAAESVWPRGGYVKRLGGWDGRPPLEEPEHVCPECPQVTLESFESSDLEVLVVQLPLWDGDDDDDTPYPVVDMSPQPRSRCSQCGSDNRVVEGWVPAEQADRALCAGCWAKVPG